MDNKVILPHQIHHHCNMLSDKIRINAYKQALKEIVQTNSCVVDIGTGTGILAGIATNYTNNSIYALEYYSDSAIFAKKSIQNNQVRVINKSSYGKPINDSPDIVVTETIGAIGPEENIVELCLEFKKCYPCIKNIIPAKLNVYAIPINSKLIKIKKQKFLQPFLDNYSESIDFKWATKQIEQHYCHQLLSENLSSAHNTAQESLMTSYSLGETKSSEFKFTINEGIDNCDAVHLYFEAILSEKTKLSSSYQCPLTHWQHRYVCKPENAHSLSINYNKKIQKMEFLWN